MLKRGIALVVLCFASFAQTALAFVDPPWIAPTNPAAGQPVTVHILAGRNDDGCDAVLSAFGYPQIHQDGSVVTLTAFGSRETDSEICSTYGTGTYDVPLGSFAPGSYTVQVDYRYVGFSGLLQTERIGSLPLTAAPLAALSVPAPRLGGWGPVVLLLILCGVANRFLRLHSTGNLTLIAILLIPAGVRATTFQPEQTLMVLISTAPRAPKAEDLITYFRSQPRVGRVPLQGLAVGNPQLATYLIPD